jgi:hypothetical protein
MFHAKGRAIARNYKTCQHPNAGLCRQSPVVLKSALRTVAAGLALNPYAQELLLMQEALKAAPPGEPVDVTPFTIR